MTNGPPESPMQAPLNIPELVHISSSETLYPLDLHSSLEIIRKMIALNPIGKENVAKGVV